MAIRILDIMPISYIMPVRPVKPADDDELSDEIKRELDELGIEIVDGMTEAEALDKISAAKAKIAQQAQLEQNAQTLRGLATDIQNFARKIGININDDGNVEEIFNYMENYISYQANQVEQEPDQYEHYSNLFSELRTLKDRYISIQLLQGSLYDMMNVEAANNRISLGL